MHEPELIGPPWITIWPCGDRAKVDHITAKLGKLSHVGGACDDDQVATLVAFQPGKEVKMVMSAVARVPFAKLQPLWRKPVHQLNQIFTLVGNHQRVRMGGARLCHG